MNISNKTLELTKDNILQYVLIDQIYRHYLGSNLIYNRAFSSPFREDKNPSFLVSSRYTWKDFTTGEYGDCFSLVMKLYNVNFYEALKQIAYDFNISNKFNISDSSFLLSKKLQIKNLSNRTSLEGNYLLKVKVRKFNKDDLDFWNSYGISLKFLKIGRVYAISHYFINNKPYKAERYAYAFLEKKDEKPTFKIYQPFSKYKKWINNNDYSVWELWSLLPSSNDNLIITSSRKDALAIIENLHLPSVSFQCETIMPKDHVLESVLNRFKNTYLLYDNDYDAKENWGQKQAKKILNKYNVKNILIPEFYKSKDFSDLIYNHGRSKATNILKELL